MEETNVSTQPEPKKPAQTPKPRKQKKETLENLIAGITPENRHPETDWGRPVGKEIW